MTATCGIPVVVNVATGKRPFRITMRRCGGPALQPPTLGYDEHGPIHLAARCAQHAVNHNQLEAA